MWSQILPGLRIKLFMTVLLGVIYPLVVTGLCQVLFPHQANGSLIRSGNQVVGSELIGQPFTKAVYFAPRPSAAGTGYDATSSSGSNLGPTSAKLLFGSTKMDDRKNEVVDFDGISLRVLRYCLDNGLDYELSAPLAQFQDARGNLDEVKLIKAFNDAKTPLVVRAKEPVPGDAVTGSASGLDPEISPANAQIQTARVAKARGISPDEVKRLVAEATERPSLGILGEPRVNVLRLNLLLDQKFPATR